MIGRCPRPTGINIHLHQAGQEEKGTNLFLSRHSRLYSVILKINLSPFSKKLPYTSARPEPSNRRKSGVFAVAMDASSARAVAATIQSIKDPRRLPALLNKRAAIAACSGVKSCCCPTILVAKDISKGEIGPHRNSVQATVLILSVWPSAIQALSFRSSGEPGSSARIRKLVSRWIILAQETAVGQMPGARLSGLAPKAKYRFYVRAGKSVIG